MISNTAIWLNLPQFMTIKAFLYCYTWSAFASVTCWVVYRFKQSKVTASIVFFSAVCGVSGWGSPTRRRTWGSQPRSAAPSPSPSTSGSGVRLSARAGSYC